MAVVQSGNWIIVKEKFLAFSHPVWHSNEVNTDLTQMSAKLVHLYLARHV